MEGDGDMVGVFSGEVNWVWIGLENFEAEEVVVERFLKREGLMLTVWCRCF